MNWISWDEAHRTGHAGMDASHRKLIDLVNQLADAMQNDKPKEFCSNVLDQFIEDAKSHFAAEEILMDARQYPKAKQHKAMHEMMLKDVLSFKASYDAGETAEFTTLLVILDNWLARDIARADKALAAFVAAVG